MDMLMGYEVIDDSSSDSTTEIDETPTDTPTALDDAPTEEDEMKCYRNGGCGPYEQLSCGECPASKPEYNSGENDGKTKHDKPRLAEVLGVEVGEKFTFHDRELWVDEQGLMHDLDGYVSGNTVCDVVNHPESIVRAPRLTEAEVAIMRAVGAKWVSLSENVNNERVVLWRNRPEKTKKGTYLGAISIAYVNIDRFPSVKPGDLIGLEETK